MHYRQFVHEVSQGNIKPFYFFFGEDDFLLKEGLHPLKEAFLPEGGDPEYIEEGEKAARVLSRARGGDIFSQRKLLVWKNPSFIKEKSAGTEEEVLLAYAQRPVSDVCLVLFAPGVDRRRTFYKTLLKDRLAYDFNPFKGRELAAWTRERARLLGKELKAPVLDNLLLVTGENMARLAGELEKIALYLGEEKEITQEVLDSLVSSSFQVNIFALVDLLGEERKDKGIFLLREMLSRGEPPLRILFMISRQLQLLQRAAAAAREGVPSREWPRHLGVAPFVAQKLARQKDTFDKARLAKALALTREADYAIKTGKKGPELALELLLLKL